jgi:lauroyl/myristoyl acyltransferase
MGLQRLVDSSTAGAWGLRLARALPPGMGLWVSDWIARRVAARKELPLVKAIQANQRVVQPERCVSDSALNAAVVEVLRHTVRAFYLLFHNLDNEVVLRGFIAPDPLIDQLVLESHQHQRGVLLLGMHMCYFDLALQGLARSGIQALALSLPETTQAIDWQHELRRRSGLEILPATRQNLRLAIQRMQAGEFAVTGVDRPLQETKYTPRFFGHPAQLPVHYVQLALHAKVPVRLLAPVMTGKGKIQILFSPEIEMREYLDRTQALLLNAERILDFASDVIARYPTQWGITWPVWPQLQQEISV